MLILSPSGILCGAVQDHAARVDMCRFDKTGTITAEILVLEGVVGGEYVLLLQVVDQIVFFIACRIE